ncbi:hypothetical protein MTY66_24640 [Mycolicibacterium sp. TY66]|uniref:hypothetical protein n=1 Tax=unclassified Mycolicibacterium TaxID=2636767 RepID=UPI001BB31A90|nr:MULTISPECIES: hypothetical protein [unclassified Mycolicibacterium]BCI80839.1 hypothetical protein MTY66_24640 [Mycolicibacterium sp. TY66]BCJ81501.1 hypothetical protein MTY81_28740 [Mycolicibacterium sp. TY81]
MFAARQWKLIVLTVLFGAAEAFFINKVSGENPAWWWWLLLSVALVGAVGCAIWAVMPPVGATGIARRANTTDSNVNTGGSVIHQSVGGGGRNKNISVRADNGSFAVGAIGTIGQLNVGAPVRREDPAGHKQA